MTLAGMEFPIFTAAAVQAAPVWLEAQATAEKAASMIKQAADKGRKADRLSRSVPARLSLLELDHGSGYRQCLV